MNGLIVTGIALLALAVAGAAHWRVSRLRRALDCAIAARRLESVVARG